MPLITYKVLIVILFVQFFQPSLTAFTNNKNKIQINKISIDEFQQDNDKLLSPIIFVPGDGGSQLEATLDKTSVVHYGCQKKTDKYFNIWLNEYLLVPWVIDCWIDNVLLVYDPITRMTTNSPGVTIRVPGWGDPEVVEWIDPSHSSAGAYFKDIANALVAIGYERRKNLFGAPYDFRKAPNENKQWFLDVKTLTESAYKNNNTAVTFIVHSMGAPMILNFLQQQNDQWKAKYIARVISLAGAWAGSVKAIKVYAMGDNLGSTFLNSAVMRTEQITNPSLAWLLPSHYFWKPDEVLIETIVRNYTTAELEDYFNEINYTNGWEMRKDTLKYTDFTAPGVELHCIYGSGLDTVERIHYATPVDKGYPDLKYGDGDGTVNLRSLEACKHWQGMPQQNNKNISILNIPKAEHMKLLNKPEIIQYILNTLK